MINENNQVPSSSLDITEQNIEKLKELFPEVLTEKKIDFDKLRLILGDEVETAPERYSFTWNGKKQAMQLAQQPTVATLKPNMEKSLNWDETDNLYIEGDNLEVLKVLQKSYSNKVKLIYVDPPYNTGKDFVYKDNFKDSIENYLQQTGQVDNDGNKLNVNSETSGRYHTDWLNMMYPRLKLAYNLLTEDGVFFVNLSDAEAFNMKKIADEIFGEKNFLADIAWNSTKSVTNTAIISGSVTHTLVYFKSMDYFVKNRNEFRIPDDGEGFSNPDNDPRGPWKADPFQVGGVRPNQLYEIVNPNTGVSYYPNEGSSWKNEYSRFVELMNDNRIVFGTTGESGPQRKRFLFEALERGKVSKTLWDDVETTTNGTARIKRLFGDTVFSNPKPVQLLERIIELGGSRDGIVLDFFSGSATTAEAVLKKNKEDGGNRKFILVQLPENLDDSLKTSNNDAKPVLKTAIKYLDKINRPHFLTEVGEERIRLAVKDLELDSNVGFKVFELSKSNIKKWNAEPKDLNEQFELLANNFEEGSKPIDVVYEIMLKQGLDLTYPISETKVGEAVVYDIAFGAMFVVLGDKITSEVASHIIKQIADEEAENSVVVLQDEKFINDSEKLNTIEQLNASGIQYNDILSI
ncbi:site-specific DNA-methyltransferase [Enterococcus faecalis]|uniref:site-specific DNA-methyltransferase n=1 Tax=Enterococcus faecalis TaxID=1351 RepID=UPI0013D5A7C5|nr:site-specific DNA-methyltransferase [Enterococcus faecalis]NGG31386.1 site-specific DNA-methyltransferase [Enterococcus faecalis]HDT8175022.1 site-specific DNA-methyltransferase [Enterococcus faecalis]